MKSKGTGVWIDECDSFLSWGYRLKSIGHCIARLELFQEKSQNTASSPKSTKYLKLRKTTDPRLLSVFILVQLFTTGDTGSRVLASI